jgi:ribosomal protein S12 methylthiotransferase
MMGLIPEKYSFTNSLKEADFFVVNSCAFIRTARDETIAALRDVFKGKKKSAKVIVAGCMVNTFEKEIKNLFPDIFYFLGSGNAKDIVKAIEAKRKSKTITKRSYLEKENAKRFLTTYPFAYLKIAEGCKKRCSYCLIPHIKGPLKSKSIDQIVGEVKSFLKKNVLEIILVAQSLTDYGKDLKDGSSLEKLLKEILKIKGKFYIRLLYLYPSGISDELVKIIKNNKKIYKYVDIPIQHVNGEILKKMGRGGSSKEIISTVEKLKKIKGMVIRTTLMAGFPGESEKQFLELLKFVKKYKLDHVGVFKYSKEKNTLAYDLKKQIRESVKDKRLEKLYLAQQRNVFEKNKKYIGKVLDVLIEGAFVGDNLRGRFYGQAPDVDPIVLINDRKNFKGFNKIYPVKITNFLGYDLVGKIVKRS